MVTTVSVKYRSKKKAGLVIKKKLQMFFLLAGVELQNKMFTQSRVRPDGKGGADGAVYLGFLSSSQQILSRDYKHVSVGSPLKYSRKLALGLPDPDVDINDLIQWATRKQIPVNIEALFEKIKTRGPMANPYHIRASDKFIAELPNIVRKVKDS